jgi:hypothetical protein
MGFKANAIENEYAFAWYLNWKRKSVDLLDALPNEQTDILFTRDSHPLSGRSPS